jgi:hypothetical protein
MEASPRPSLEPLAELPVEQPLDAGVPPKEPPTVAAGAPAPPPATGSVEPSKGPEHADLNFTDPELYLAPADPRVAAVSAASPAAPSQPPEPPLELTLEDPVIDELLTTPAPPPKAAAPPAPGTSKPSADQPALHAIRTAPAAPARVPVAKTATLAAAAQKLAAATAARSSARPPSIPAAPVVPAARAPAAPAAPPKAMAPQAPRVEKPRLEALRLETPRAETQASRAEAPPRAEAPGLASWASARASASMTRPGAPTAVPPAPSAPAASTAPVHRSATLKAVASAPAPASAASGATTSPPMDRDFIARNQVVERYLSGRLPLKGATDFERFCRQHPEILDEIGLPERVNAGLRLLEASGKPEPWHEPARPLWQKPPVILGLAVAVVILALTLVVAWGATVTRDHQIAALEKQAYERALDPATSTREIRLLPSRAGASATPAITIGGHNAQLADFKIDESRSPYHSFRVTIDRIDQGRVGVITNLTKDSNGHLRIALNSSALGPGNYQLTIEGIGWRGEPEPDSWITIGIAR